MSKDNKAVMLYRLQSVARLTRTVLATRLLELGLYAGQDAVMLQLASEDGLPPGILAQRLGVRPPTITKTITRLQSQGFVVKRASETDQRQSHVFLTPQGSKQSRSLKSPFARRKGHAERSRQEGTQGFPEDARTHGKQSCGAWCSTSF